MAKFNVRVNDQFDFEIEVQGEDIQLNGEKAQADISALNQHRFHVIDQNKSYYAELISFNSDEKLMEIKVNQHIYHLVIEDEYSGLLKKMGLDGLVNKPIAEIKAPMPGMVLQLFVRENEEVKKGDNLFVLEAMKMENMIKSPVDGYIKKLQAQVGDKVEKNQVILQFRT